ncbi:MULTISPECIES: hypothetical protein [unclassified Rhodococcus (in: high G+C Gram-positive bacteria)]|uniref:hypothetical protein n=1 Tax=unclassified Rhodococcus (in: high G+C Gram-positive bacteria) TaxID=192944 RepID=UPI0020788D02|nr:MULTISPECIES: hypothetical protein [unclassified Rhodococcus (in: high G+C Gram-positive bacteria)]
MTDAVTVDEDGRYLLRLARHLPYLREDVWRGVLELRRHSARALSCSCADSPALLEYRNRDSVLRWEIDSDGPARSLLIFTHRCGDRHDGVDAMGWWLTELDVLPEILDGHPRVRSPTPGSGNDPPLPLHLRVKCGRQHRQPCRQCPRAHRFVKGGELR